MSWQGGAVLILLFLSVIASKLIKSHPRDLIFAIGSLLTPLFGIIPSGQICQAFSNQIILAVLGFWVFTKTLHSISHWKAYVALLLFSASLGAFIVGVAIGTSFFCAGLLLFLFRPFPIEKTFREEFPLPLLLEIFSAYLFFFAITNSGLSKWTASFLQDSSPWIFLALAFFAAQFFSFFIPLPVVFAILFSLASALFHESSVLFAAGATIAFSLIFRGCLKFHFPHEKDLFGLYR